MDKFVIKRKRVDSIIDDKIVVMEYAKVKWATPFWTALLGVVTERSSDDQYMNMASNGAMMMDVSADAKKAKMDGSANRPSRVLHIRGVPSDAMEGEVVQLGLPFGRMTNMVLARKKNQALLEMADIQTAQAMINYYSERPPQIRGRTVYMQFSNHEQLKTESSSSLNAGAQAALQVADQMIGNLEEAHTVLRVIIDNMMYPITIDILKMIFSKYGQVLRIVTYNKNNQFQALIQYSDAIAAQAGRAGLNGQNIYNGCCTLRIDFSKMTTLTVKYNNDKMWDFTNPSLPTGNEGQSQGPESMGDGILGSFNGGNPGAFGFGGMNNFGGNANMGMQGMQKMGGVPGLGGMGGSMPGMSSMGVSTGAGNMHGIGSMAGLGGLGNMGAMGGIPGLGGMPGMGAMPGMGGMGGMHGMSGMGGMGGMMGGGPPQPVNNVLIVSNLCEEKVNPDVIFTLFGVYGTVQRVKILYNKKDTALVQYADSMQAHNAMQCLDKLQWWGKNIKVSLSKHTHIQLPKEGQSESWMTKDFTNSQLHRFKNPNSKNASNVNPPSATLHLSNIAVSTTEGDLKDLFGQYGTVTGFKFLMKDKKMALIQMETLEEAIEALVELHNHEVGGSHLRVSFTKSTI